MADENKPELQRVRYNMAVTVDGVTHPARTYEVEVSADAARALVANGRAVVSTQSASAASSASAPPVALTPEQVAAVAAALTQPGAAQPVAAQPAAQPASPASTAPATPPKS